MGKEFDKNRKDKKHSYFLKIINQHRNALPKEKSLAKLPTLKRESVSYIKLSGIATIKDSFAHEVYRPKTDISNYVWEIKKKQGVDLLLKWDIVKKCHKYKVGDKY